MSISEKGVPKGEWSLLFPKGGALGSVGSDLSCPLGHPLFELVVRSNDGGVGTMQMARPPGVLLVP